MNMDSSKTNPKTIVLKNSTEIRNILSEITKSKTQICIIASNWSFNSNPPSYYSLSWNEKLKENGQQVYTILSDSFLGEERELSEIYKVRFISNLFISPSTLILFEDKVLLINGIKESSGVLFKGKEISERYKQYFVLLWESSKNGQAMEKAQEKFKNTRRR